MTLRVAAFNNSGSSISKRQVVQETGIIRPQQLPMISLASAATISGAAVFGVANQDIANGSVGELTVAGTVKLDTSGYAVNDLVYLSDTPGDISPIPGTNNAIVGVVLTVDINGCILLKEVTDPNGCS